MWLLAQFVCLIFATTATGAIIPNLLSVVEEMLNEKINSSRKEIKIHHEDAKTSVDRALLQIMFVIPYEGPPSSKHTHVYSFSNDNSLSGPGNVRKWKGSGLEIEKKLRRKVDGTSGQPPSTACYEFLKTYVTTNWSAVRKCSWYRHWQVEAYRMLLDEAFRLAINRLEEKEDAAKNCKSWWDAALFNNWFAVVCMFRIKWSLSEIVEEAMTNFSGIANNAKDVVNAWIPEAGHCLIANDTLIAVLKWNAACRYGTEPVKI